MTDDPPLGPRALGLMGNVTGRPENPYGPSPIFGDHRQGITAAEFDKVAGKHRRLFMLRTEEERAHIAAAVNRVLYGGIVDRDPFDGLIERD